MSVRAGAARPLRAPGRGTEARRAVAGRLGAIGRRPGLSQQGSVSLLIIAIAMGMIALMVLLADFVAVLAAHGASRTAADAAARGALRAWQDASPDHQGGPPPACAALSAFADAYEPITAAAAYYAGANGARLDPGRPPLLVLRPDGLAVRVAVLGPLHLVRYEALLDQAHRELHSSSDARWPEPAPEWSAAAWECPSLLP